MKISITKPTVLFDLNEVKRTLAKVEDRNPHDRRTKEGRAYTKALVDAVNELKAMGDRP